MPSDFWWKNYKFCSIDAYFLILFFKGSKVICQRGKTFFFHQKSEGIAFTFCRYLNQNMRAFKFYRYCLQIYFLMPSKGVWTYAYRKSRHGLKDYIEHGPCMTENFCLWIRNASKFNPMEGIFLKTSIFNSSYLIFLIFPGLKK